MCSEVYLDNGSYESLDEHYHDPVGLRCFVFNTTNALICTRASNSVANADDNVWHLGDGSIDTSTGLTAISAM